MSWALQHNSFVKPWRNTVGNPSGRWLSESGWVGVMVLSRLGLGFSEVFLVFWGSERARVLGNFCQVFRFFW